MWRKIKTMLNTYWGSVNKCNKGARDNGRNVIIGNTLERKLKSIMSTKRF